MQETRLANDPKEKESEIWKVNKVQLVYDTSESTHFINAYNREYGTRLDNDYYYYCY